MVRVAIYLCLGPADCYITLLGWCGLQKQLCLGGTGYYVAILAQVIVAQVICAQASPHGPMDRFRVGMTVVSRGLAHKGCLDGTRGRVVADVYTPDCVRQSLGLSCHERHPIEVHFDDPRTSPFSKRRRRRMCLSCSPQTVHLEPLDSWLALHPRHLADPESTRRGLEICIGIVKGES